MKKIFIDGKSGTTGLEIVQQIKKDQRLEGWVELIDIEADHKKRWEDRVERYRLADLILLCLPDQASIEAVKWIRQDERIVAKVLDTSTAHRTALGWVYGFPELTCFESMIRESRWVANPGCYATGMIALLRPLVELELLGDDALITSSACSGYSGGGRKMIERYQKGQQGVKRKFYTSCHPYAIDLDHKHLAEIKKIVGLKTTPIFQPYVMGTDRGMLVSVPIRKNTFRRKVDERVLKNSYEKYYGGCQRIKVRLKQEDKMVEGQFIDPTLNNQTNSLDIIISGNQEVINLHARLDNLGKGASGAALQNIKLMLNL